jgi:hypothetical protein
MTYPEFGKAVSDWLSGMLTKESMASPDNLRKVYYTIGELRSVGPIAPDKMIPILIHTLDLYASPQWPLSLLAMYGKAAEPARERVEQLIDSDDYWVKNNAIEVISRLQ